MSIATGKKLGILLSAHPDKGDLPAIRGLALAARAAGTDTYLYLIDEGARAYKDPLMETLREAGVKLYVCAYGAMPRGVEPDEGAVFGGLAALGGLMDACDRFVSFN
ncbi:MAG: DsrE family protein [Nitrospirota bacterium]|nr:DsrE family protein [Nitrospirota bacterium]